VQRKTGLVAKRQLQPYAPHGVKRNNYNITSMLAGIFLKSLPLPQKSNGCPTQASAGHEETDGETFRWVKV